MSDNKLFEKTFIQQIINGDIKKNRIDKVITRFPPEPNGYLHIGHAKAICISFSTASNNNGICNLRLDDTNPTKEDDEFVNAIKEDIKWLGYDWETREYFASNYFDKLYKIAKKLIKENKAFVCDLSAEDMREYRGTLTEIGQNSPFRNRTIEENLALFEKMRNGEFSEGSHVLRAKIDMSSPNINLRDPVMYRIINKPHHRTGDKWHIYPMYDFAHPLSDAFEGVTHSLCSMEFEDHRVLYDWFVQESGVTGTPKQIEFGRLNLTYTIMSKRKLSKLVEENFVNGWNDPRMPTLSGMRRRGYTAKAIRKFVDGVGVGKNTSNAELPLLEHYVRKDLNDISQRVMVVLDPIKLIIDNFQKDKEYSFKIENNPENDEDGNRTVTFTKELFIERDDFMENAPKKFFRMSIGREVRLKKAFLVTCTSVEKDANGKITVIHCNYDKKSEGGDAPDGRKVKGTIHWVSAKYGEKITVNNYDNLFAVENPEETKEGLDFTSNISKNSLEVKNAVAEPSVIDNLVFDNKIIHFQFLRNGYYCKDKDFSASNPVFNRTVLLREKKKFK